MDGLIIADVVASKGYKIKSKTKTSLVVLVKGNRVKEMQDLAQLLSNLGAKVDSSLKGSSIGGILVGKVKILIKQDGKTGGLDVESMAINTLQEAILNAASTCGGSITVKIGMKKVDGIVGVEKTPGTPKSDFHLVDKSGRELVYISHKKGSTPKDFQQWGGVTEKEIAEHPIVVEFATRCKARFGDRIGSGESAYMVIPDNAIGKELKMMSVFGVDSVTTARSRNNVDVLIQGDPGLKQIKPGLFELTGNHVHYHGDVPNNGFDPVLAIIYKGDRDQFGIKGARVSIYPTGGRTFKEKL